MESASPASRGTDRISRAIRYRATCCFDPADGTRSRVHDPAPFHPDLMKTVHSHLHNVDCRSHRRSGRCIFFSKCPVHTVVYDRLSIPPVCCIDNARCTVGVDHPLPRGCTILRNRQVFFCRIRIIRIGRKRPLCDQPRPLDAVPRRCSIRLKRVVRLVLIAVQFGDPFLCKVLRNSPLVHFLPSLLHDR